MVGIVAGEARGRRLQVPPRVTRPTSDRVREAVFSSISARMDLTGCRVLDLFAGSGALGFEALSRGADHALLVESDRGAVAVLRRNAEALGLPGAVILGRTVQAALRDAPAESYDLVLADPPYALSNDELGEILVTLLEVGWLAPDALIVLERSVRDPEPDWPEGMIEITSRRYGDTQVYYRLAP